MLFWKRNNTLPSTLFGGEWILENKSFTPFEDSKSDGTYLKHDTTNCSSSSLALRRNGQTVSLKISITPTIDLADTSITLGQLNLSKIGIKNIFPSSITAYPFTTDAGHGIALVTISATGTVSSVEVVPRNSDTTLDTDTHAIGSFLTITCNPNDMLDSCCNQFFWRRIT